MQDVGRLVTSNMHVLRDGSDKCHRDRKENGVVAAGFQISIQPIYFGR